MVVTTQSRTMESSKALESALTLDDNASEAFAESQDEDFETAGMMSDDESVNTRILFVAEKQKILKRASAILLDEDSLDSAYAMSTPHDSALKPSETSGTIWNEARGILRALSAKTGESDTPGCAATKFTPSTRGPSRSTRKRPKIDIGSVNRLSAEEYSNANSEPVKPKAVSFLSNSPVAGKWMANALISNSKSYTFQQSQGNDTRWKIVSDPTQKHPLGLSPPSPLNTNRYIRMQDAISVTSEGRLMTTSTPPFAIIHANKAFLQKIGCRSQDVVGKPIESIVQVLHSNSSTFDPSSARTVLRSVVKLSKKNHTPCNIRIVPVADCQGTLVTHVMLELVLPGTTERVPSQVTRTIRRPVPTYPQGMVGAVG